MRKTSVKSAEKKGDGRIDPTGFDASKRIKGKKRDVLVGTRGLLMEATDHAVDTDIQDRDGGVMLMATLSGLYPFLLKFYADAPTRRQSISRDMVHVCRAVNVEIVRRSDAPKVRGVTQALDCGTHHRLAELPPTPEQGLGVPQSDRTRFPPIGISPDGAQKTP